MLSSRTGARFYMREWYYQIDIYHIIIRSIILSTIYQICLIDYYYLTDYYWAIYIHSYIYIYIYVYSPMYIYIYI